MFLLLGDLVIVSFQVSSEKEDLQEKWLCQCFLSIQTVGSSILCSTDIAPMSVMSNDSPANLKVEVCLCVYRTCTCALKFADWND